ncbi:MAG TPA: chloride channel protein [Actinomycetota bacterium]
MKREMRFLGLASARLRRAGYLRKWLVLGVLIGIVAGFGAIAFSAALRWATHLLLGVIGGYTPPAPAGEGATLGSGSHFTRPWAIPFVVGLGGLVSGILVFGFAPEAEGHGTDAAVGAVHHGPKGIRGRVSFVKILASAITIGSGGSGGREGPTAQISAGFGSMLGRWLDLTPSDARIAVTVGIGSGIGAIFRAPLGGAVLGAEVLYREDVEADALIPSLIASIVGFAVFGAAEGFSPIFGTTGYHFHQPAELIYYAVIGVTGGLLGRLYARSFYGLAHLNRRVPGSPLIKPAVAGLMVGVIALVVPEVLATGYGWVQVAMTGAILTLPLWVVIALPFAKILATSLSIGSGGSGGIFGPGMVIGGFLGAAVWRLAHDLPAVPHSPAPFVVVGMIACFGSIAHAPLAVMLMVAEMTGTLEMLAPAMVAVGLASVVVGDATIYESQLRNRTESPAHRFRFGLPLLASLPVTEAMRPPRLVLAQDVTAREACEQLVELGLAGAPIGDRSGVYQGSVDVDLVASADPEGRVGSLTDGHHSSVPDDATLDAVVEIFSTEHVAWVPILDAERRIVGIVSTADLIGAYRHSLAASLRSLRSIFSGSILVEGEVRSGSEAVDRTIADAGWPPGTVVVAIQRGEQLIFPEPTTTIREDDVLSALVPSSAEQRLRRALGAESEPDEGAMDVPMV